MLANIYLKQNELKPTKWNEERVSFCKFKFDKVIQIVQQERYVKQFVEIKKT
jgi:hypothetical protein